MAPEAAENVNPSDTGDVVGRYARASREQAETGDRCGQRRIPGMVALRHPAAPRHPEEGLRRDPGAQGRTRPPARARGRQDAAGGHRRGDARRADIRFLLGRGPAACRREACLHAARHRRRAHPRAGRRRRHHHAVELPDRHSRLEDRAGARLRQLRRLQAGRPGAGLGLGAFRHHHSRRHSEGVFNLVMGRGSVVGDAMLNDRPTSTPSPSPARSGPARRSPRPASSTCASSSSRWAARTRSSCSTTPISTSPSMSPSTAPSSRPASAARRPPASSSPKASTTSSSRARRSA